MIKREYYSLKDSVGIFGLSEGDLIHFGARSRIPIYILLANWRVRCFIRMGKEHYESSDSSIYKKLLPRCLLKYEAGDLNVEPSIEPDELLLTVNGLENVDDREKAFYDLDKSTGIWSRSVGDKVFSLDRPGYHYPHYEELADYQRRGGNVDDIYPSPVLLSECVMVVMSADMDKFLKNPHDVQKNNIEISSRDKFRRDIDKWLYETWISQGKPGSSSYLQMLKKYRRQPDSPIIDVWTEVKGSGFSWETKNSSGSMALRTLNNKVTSFKILTR
ncbi:MULTISPECIES: hypothetical protein [Methylomonas]|uniref:Uncharacterized protein n=1 Tax=Methylomonas methanica TaxID=421 RepID=A0ABY2CNC2_METMH|nr:MULTISPECIES: hypothetical protein [Methylomonas]TCV82274.1 hypothetical protein EDE11_11437 [Methylomonas methanica]